MFCKMNQMWLAQDLFASERIRIRLQSIGYERVYYDINFRRLVSAMEIDLALILRVQIFKRPRDDRFGLLVSVSSRTVGPYSVLYVPSEVPANQRADRPQH
jgi:hypothetical protein